MSEVLDLEKLHPKKLLELYTSALRKGHYGSASSIHDELIARINKAETPPNVTTLEWMYADDVPEFVMQEWFYRYPAQGMMAPLPKAELWDSKNHLLFRKPPGTIYARVPDRPVFDRPKPPSLEELVDDLDRAIVAFMRSHYADPQLDDGLSERVKTIKAEILKHYGGEK